MQKPEPFFIKHKYVFLIVVTALCELAAFDWLLEFRKQSIFLPDSTNYMDAAQKLYFDFSLHHFRPLLMALVSGIPYAFGCSDFAVLQWSFFLNICCWVVTAILVFKIISFFTSEKTAFFFSLFSLFFVGNVALTYFLLTESLYTVFIALGMYLFFRYYKDKKFVFLSLALSVFILSMLIKPGSKFLAVGLCLYTIVAVYRNYRNRSVFLILASFILVAFQLIGMKKQYGDYTISYIDGFTYYNYLGSRAVAIEKGKDFDAVSYERASIIRNLDFSVGKKAVFSDLISQIKEDPIPLAKAYFINVYDNIKPGNSVIGAAKNLNHSPYFESVKQLLYNISKWQNRLFTILRFLLGGYFVIKKYKSDKAITITAFFILYIIGTSGISCGEGDRFHLVPFPFTMVLIAKFISERNFFRPQS